MSNLGFIDAMRGDEHGAEQWYEHAIAVDPTYPHVYRRLADLFYDRKDWPRALEYYRHVLVMLPRHFEALIQAGNTARFLDDPGTAAGYYEDAARVRPDSWIPAYNLACLRATEGDPRGALALLGDATRLGFVAPRLLDENPDFDSVRALSGWDELAAQVRIAAAAVPAIPVTSIPSRHGATRRAQGRSASTPRRPWPHHDGAGTASRAARARTVGREA